MRGGLGPQLAGPLSHRCQPDAGSPLAAGVPVVRDDDREAVVARPQSNLGSRRAAVSGDIGERLHDDSVRSDFDGRGQVWKTTRHMIDASDGSDDDNLETLNWYDSTGRLIKVDGQQFTKTFYDRLGRQTHQFILAVALNGASAESDYADASTLTDDIVLEEHQAVYESSDSDDVLLRVDIARYHSDFGGGAPT